MSGMKKWWGLGYNTTMGQLFFLYILVCVKAGLGIAWYDYVFLAALAGAAYWKHRLFKKSSAYAMDRMNKAVEDLAEIQKKKEDENKNSETDPFESITT